MREVDTLVRSPFSFLLLGGELDLELMIHGQILKFFCQPGIGGFHGPIGIVDEDHRGFVVVHVGREAYLYEQIRLSQSGTPPVDLLAGRERTYLQGTREILRVSVLSIFARNRQFANLAEPRAALRLYHPNDVSLDVEGVVDESFNFGEY